jgi:excisionase family DNA binding protein
MLSGGNRTLQNTNYVLLSVPDFANKLGVSDSCVRAWILRRRITIVKVGRLVRVPSSEIDRLLEAGVRHALRVG